MSLETASCTSATASEKKAFQELLCNAKEDFGKKLKVVTTDGHIGIAAHMRDKEDDIDHNQVRRIHSSVSCWWCTYPNQLIEDCHQETLVIRLVGCGDVKKHWCASDVLLQLPSMLPTLFSSNLPSLVNSRFR
jgi:hypothetical protein